MVRRLAGLGLVLLVVSALTAGCSGSDEAVPPAASAADRCTEYVLSAMEKTYRPGGDSGAVFDQVMYDHGVESVEYRAFDQALRGDFATVLVADGMAAALEAARPTVAAVCGDASDS